MSTDNKLKEIKLRLQLIMLLRKLNKIYAHDKALKHFSNLVNDKPIWRTIGGSDNSRRDRRRGDREGSGRRFQIESTTGRILKGGPPEMKGQTFKEAFSDTVKKATSNQQQRSKNPKAAKTKNLSKEQLIAIHAKKNGGLTLGKNINLSQPPNDSPLASLLKINRYDKIQERSQPQTILSRDKRQQIDQKFLTNISAAVKNASNIEKSIRPQPSKPFKPLQISHDDYNKAITAIAPSYSELYKKWDKTEKGQAFLASLRHYSGLGYKGINQTLRGVDHRPPEMFADHINNISEALEKCKTPVDLLGYRGGNAAELASYLGLQNLTEFKNMSTDELNRLFCGANIQPSTFLSTSVIESKSFEDSGPFSGDMQLTIEIPKGSKGAWLSHVDKERQRFKHPDEYEILLQRSSIFKVKHIANNDGIITARLLLIDQEKPKDFYGTKQK